MKYETMASTLQVLLLQEPATSGLRKTILYTGLEMLNMLTHIYVDFCAPTVGAPNFLSGHPYSANWPFQIKRRKDYSGGARVYFGVGGLEELVNS